MIGYYIFDPAAFNYILNLNFLLFLFGQFTALFEMIFSNAKNYSR